MNRNITHAASVSDARRRSAGIACGLGVVILFSGFTLASRFGLGSTLKPVDMAALRFGIGGVLLLPLLARHGLSGLHWHQAAALAFFGGLGFALLAYAGFSLSPASHGAVLLHGTLPLFTLGLVRMTSGAKARGHQLFGLAMIALGVVAMAWDSLVAASPLQLMGDGALLLASASWATYGVLARRLGVPAARAAGIVAVFSMCLFLPLYAALPGKAIFMASWQELLFQGVFQGVLIGVVSLFVYTHAVACLGAVETALFTAAVPCVTALGALFWLAEMPSPAAWSGIAVVTLGMVVAMRAGSSPTVTDIR